MKKKLFDELVKSIQEAGEMSNVLKSVKLRRVAGAAVVTIPAEYLRALRWADGDVVTIVLDGTRLVVTRAAGGSGRREPLAPLAE